MRKLIAAASGALALCFALDAAAYCLAKAKANVAFPKWTTQPVTYRISDNVTDAKIIAAIDAAFTSWGSVTCSKLKFTKGASFTPCLVEPCAAGTVKFEYACSVEPCGPGTIKYPTTTPAIYVFWVTSAFAKFDNPGGMAFSRASYYWQDNIGSITGGSIAVNAKDYKFTDASAGCTGTVFDTKNFMMPLIGTVIGLSQSDYSPAVMDNKPIGYCATDKQTPLPDDKNAIYFHYSDGTCPTPPKPGADGCAGGPTGTTGDGKPVARDGGVTKGDGTGGPVSESGVPIVREAGGSPPQCTSNEQCGTGKICDSNGQCKSSGDGGCCRVSHTSSELGGIPTALMVLALLVLGLGLRRRSR